MTTKKTGAPSHQAQEDLTGAELSQAFLKGNNYSPDSPEELVQLFREWSKKHGAENPNSLQTYVKYMKRILKFLSVTHIPIEEVVEKPDKVIKLFIMKEVKASSMDDRKARVPLSIFRRHILPFFREIVRAQKKAQEGKKKKPEPSPVSMEEPAESAPPPLPAPVPAAPERAESREKEEAKEEGKQGETQALTFPAVIEIRRGNETNHLVALEKLAEDALAIKVRGFFVEDWVELILESQRERRHDRSTKEIVPPPIKIVGFPKKDMGCFEELEGVHEKSALWRALKPLMDKVREKILYNRRRW